MLVMHDVHDLAYEDIAESLGIPVGTVKSRLHRGRVALAGELGESERGRGHRTAAPPDDDHEAGAGERDASAGAEGVPDPQEPPAAPPPSKERFPE